VNDISRFEVEHQDGLICLRGGEQPVAGQIDCEVIEIPLHIRRKLVSLRQFQAERLPGFASSLQKSRTSAAESQSFSSSFPPKAESIVI